MDQLRNAVRNIPDFPIKGIIFRDITPILQDAGLTKLTKEFLYSDILPETPDAIVGVESRGFLFGVSLAEKFSCPFIMARKPGKLPYKKISTSYNLEYGSSTIEMHEDSIKPGDKVVIHDDLLATGGTVLAAAELVKQLGGKVVACSFIIELEELKGAQKIKSVLGDDVRVLSVLKY